MERKLPDGWEWKTIADIGSNDKNAIVDGPFGSNLKLCDYVADGPVPVLSIANMEKGYSKESLRYISKEKFSELKRSAVSPGDIIMAKIGSCGKCGMYPETMPVGMIPANLLKITVGQHVNREYVLYYLKSPVFQARLKSILKTAVQPAFNVTDFKNLPILLPPPVTQRKIVAILDKVEELKRLRSKANELTQRLLRSAFLEIFGDPIENTKHWKMMALDDLCYLIRDGEHRTPLYSDEGIPFITATNLVGESIDFINTKKLSPQVHKEFSKRAKPEVGDLLMSKDGTIGATQVVESPIDFSIFVSVILFKVKKNIIDPYYLKNLLTSYPIQKEINKRVKGVAIKHIHLNEIRSLSVPVPPMDEQIKFVRLERMYRQIRQGQTKSADEISNLVHLATIKAFTGELVV